MSTKLPPPAEVRYVTIDEARAEAPECFPAKPQLPSLNEGEIYAGIILGKGDEPDHHLILLPGETESITWKKAQAWAKDAGGDLPTRRELSLLHANQKDCFQPDWYWSGEQYAGGAACAWCQDFNVGIQTCYGEDFELRARAVRRELVI